MFRTCFGAWRNTYFRITGFLCNNSTITERLNDVFFCLLMVHFLKQEPQMNWFNTDRLRALSYTYSCKITAKSNFWKLFGDELAIDLRKSCKFFLLLWTPLCFVLFIANRKWLLEHLFLWLYIPVRICTNWSCFHQIYFIFFQISLCPESKIMESQHKAPAQGQDCICFQATRWPSSLKIFHMSCLNCSKLPVRPAMLQQFCSSCSWTWKGVLQLPYFVVIYKMDYL